MPDARYTPIFSIRKTRPGQSQACSFYREAGGHLALLAAGAQGIDAFEADSDHPDVSSEVAAVIGVAPVADLTEWAHRPGMSPLFGANPSANVIRAASPISYASRTYPPTLLIHGTADETVPHAMTMRMHEALKQADVPVDLHLYAGQDHFFDREPRCGEFVQPLRSDQILGVRTR